MTRTSPGGAAPEVVVRMARAAASRAAELRVSAQEHREAIDDVEARLVSSARALAGA